MNTAMLESIFAGNIVINGGFDKVAGTTVERAVYPGRAEVVVRAPGASEPSRQAIELPRGERMLLEPAPATRPLVPFGFGIHRLTPKGEDAGVTWAVAIERPTTTLSLGLSARAALVGEHRLAPRLGATLDLRADHGPWVGLLSLGYGVDHADYDAWSYQVRALVGSVGFGGSLDLSWARLTPLARIDVGHAWQTFDDGTTRQGPSIAGLAGAVLAVPLGARVALSLSIEGGIERAKDVAIGSAYRWSGLGSISAGLIFPLH